MVAGTSVLIGTGKPLFWRKLIDHRSKVDTSRRFHEFLGRVFGMGDGGAAPMEVEMGEDDEHNPTAQFFIKGERRGTQ